MPRRLLTAILAALALVALSVPALAKEGAVTRLDSLPTDWYAGQTYTLGYMIRMDGVQPYRADTTEIIATSLDGQTNLAFPGVAEGAPGHYTAKVTFPASGTYRWRVTQGSYFAPFDLGSVIVQPAVVTSGSAAAPSAPASDPLATAVPLAAAAAVLAMFALTGARRRRLVRAI